MKKSEKFSRKSFLKKLGITSAGIFSTPFILSNDDYNKNTYILDSNKNSKTYSKNDQIQLALIGAGKMGQGDTEVALEHGGVELVAACDLYDSRLVRCKEKFGDHIFITKDYKEVLNRSDVDAVIIATPDHWHNTIAIEALNQDKAVYLEKPMVQHIEEGYDLIEAEEKNSQPLIVGSTSTSDIVYLKARELYEDGEIGKLNLVESYYDRYSAIGAWQYSIPPIASTENIAWQTFLKDLPDRPFDPKRFFRWRNYRDYGTGVAGDLFVHLFSGIHLVTGSKGPNKIMSTGGLRFWNDGRNVPDIMTGMYNYPETESHPAFNLTLRVNFADGSGGGRLMRFVGSEGEIVIEGDRVRLRKASLPDAPGMTVDEFGKKVRKEYKEYYNNKYNEKRPKTVKPKVITYKAPDGYSSRFDHFERFFASIRNRSELLQDSKFGLRAAAPALASNLSYFQKKIIEWNPETMKVI